MVGAARKTQEPCKEGSRRTQEPVALILHFVCIEHFVRGTLGVRAACIECFGWGQSKQLVRVARQSRVAASLKMLPAGFLGSKVAPGRRYNPNHGVAVYGLITKTINCGPGGCSEARDSRHRSFTPGTSFLRGRSPRAPSTNGRPLSIGRRGGGRSGQSQQEYAEIECGSCVPKTTIRTMVVFGE